jgi:hypothetical protein
VTVNNNPDFCDDETNNTCNTNNDCTGGGGTPSPTPTPAPLAQCKAVKVYQLATSATCATIDSTNAACWQLLTAAEVSALQPGATIYITTQGTVANGPTITRARIQVATNGAGFAAWSQATDETVTLKPKAVVTDPNEYYKVFTLSAGTTSFTIGSEVYSAQFDTTPVSAWDDNHGWR